MASRMTLKRIKAIQKRLGLVADGIIGPATLTELEKVIEQVKGPPEKPIVHKMKITKMGLKLIIGYEISSDSYYNKHLKSPIWPGYKSGVTIGIGYDLGFYKKDEIERDWKGKIDDTDLADLKAVSGLKGAWAEKRIDSLKHIEIPLKVAKEVFLTSSVSLQAKKTKKAFPGVEKLPADAQAMLLSLVFNRGGRLRPFKRDSRDSRREMRAIRPLVADKDLKGIAEQVRAMKRLWEGKNMSGLLKRRDKEADIIENARPDDTLPEGEIILV